MPLVDSKGNLVDINSLDKHFVPYPVNPPAAVAKKAASGIGSALVGAGLNTAGAEGGLALGAALAPETGGASMLIPLLASATGAGLANVAQSKAMPPELGGNPKSSVLSDFLWGAVPQGFIHGAGNVVGKVLSRRGAEAQHLDIIEKLRSPQMGADTADKLAAELRKPNLAPRVFTDDQLTDKTFAYRSALRNPIERERQSLGAPIGRAYNDLKGNANPAPIEQLGDRIGEIQNEMRSPLSPETNRLLERIKERVTPPVNPTAAPVGFSPNQDLGNGRRFVRDLGNGNILVSTSAGEFAEIPAPTTGAGPKKQWTPPTLDEMRQWRQEVNDKLRTAKGGDVHALAAMESEIDDRMMPYLPGNIDRQRALYAGFIRRYKWQDLNRMGMLGTPEEVSRWTFTGPGAPERIKEISQWASPQERRAIRESFTDHLLRDVDPNMPPEEQVKEVREKLRPYLANGSARDLFGSDTERALKNIVYAPINRARIADLMTQPAQKKAFVDGWSQAARKGGKEAQMAAQRGLERFVQSLPQSEQARFMSNAVPGQEMPVAMEHQEALIKGLKPPGASKRVGYAAKRLEFGVPYGVARIAMGSASGGSYALATALTFGTVAAGSAGYRAAMNAGGASMIARMYASPTSRAIGRNAFEFLVQLGQKETRNQVDTGE